MNLFRVRKPNQQLAGKDSGRPIAISKAFDATKGVDKGCIRDLFRYPDVAGQQPAKVEPATEHRISTTRAGVAIRQFEQRSTGSRHFNWQHRDVGATKRAVDARLE